MGDTLIACELGLPEGDTSTLGDQTVPFVIASERAKQSVGTLGTLRRGYSGVTVTVYVTVLLDIMENVFPKVRT